MADKRLNPIHPGEVLQEEFLQPFGLDQETLSNHIGVPLREIHEIVLGRQGITADIALRLAKFFGNSAQFWLGIQSEYDIDQAREQLGDRLEKEIVPIAA